MKFLKGSRRNLNKKGASKEKGKRGKEERERMMTIRTTQKAALIQIDETQMMGDGICNLQNDATFQVKLRWCALSGLVQGSGWVEPNVASVCRVDVGSDFASPSTGSKVPVQAALSNHRAGAAALLQLCPPYAPSFPFSPHGQGQTRRRRQRKLGFSPLRQHWQQLSRPSPPPTSPPRPSAQQQGTFELKLAILREVQVQEVRAHIEKKALSLSLSLVPAREATLSAMTR
ncbi:hypothetical protein V8E52_004987 [Russula decolorans]